MFKNIGKKIKMLARILCILGIVFYVSAAIILFIISALGSSDFSALLIVYGVVLLIIGPLSAWIGSFLLYGYGEIIDKTCDIERKLSFVEKKLLEEKMKV